MEEVQSLLSQQGAVISMVICNMSILVIMVELNLVDTKIVAALHGVDGVYGGGQHRRIQVGPCTQL